jgi:hypothetical protein
LKKNALDKGIFRDGHIVAFLSANANEWMLCLYKNI